MPHSTKEKRAAYCKRYYVQDRKNNRERWKAYELKSKYGITAQDVDAMWEAQDGFCAICKRKMRRIGSQNSDACNIDHCHKLKKVRGLLCSRCNKGLGHFGDGDIKLIRSAIRYMKKFNLGMQNEMKLSSV